MHVPFHARPLIRALLQLYSERCEEKKSSNDFAFYRREILALILGEGYTLRLHERHRLSRILGRKREEVI
jgi:hypothetical protein